MSQDAYMQMKSKALILRDNGGYDHSKGEMNPVIFEEFVGEVLDRKVPEVIWEPFSGHTRRSRTQDFVADIEGLELISFDLAPADERVQESNSLGTGPGKMVGGVLFHPSYFGSTFCSDSREVGLALSEEVYVENLSATARLIGECLVPGGLVCAVGRDYRYAGKRVRLDLWYLEVFEKMGMTMVNVWLSEPDVVMIFENGARHE